MYPLVLLQNYYITISLFQIYGWNISLRIFFFLHFSSKQYFLISFIYVFLKRFIFCFVLIFGFMLCCYCHQNFMSLILAYLCDLQVKSFCLPLKQYFFYNFFHRETACYKFPKITDTRKFCFFPFKLLS